MKSFGVLHDRVTERHSVGSLSATNHSFARWPIAPAEVFRVRKIWRRRLSSPPGVGSKTFVSHPGCERGCAGSFEIWRRVPCERSNVVAAPENLSTLLLIDKDGMPTRPPTPSPTRRRR